MKKSFSRPVLKKFDLNSKENIVSSITYNDAHLSSSWDFIHLDANNETVPDPGCYGLLTDHFPTTPEDLSGALNWSYFYQQYLLYERYSINGDAAYNTEPYITNYKLYQKCASDFSL